MSTKFHLLSAVLIFLLTLVVTSLVPARADAGTIPTDVVAAMTEAMNAKTFRFQELIATSKGWFRGQYTLGKGQDPNQVTFFNVQGEGNGPNGHWVGDGVVATLIARFMGLDPQSPQIEMTILGDKQFVRGALLGSKEVKWYAVPSSGSGGSVTPSGGAQFLKYFLSTNPKPGDFARVGSESLDGLKCDVYAANRAAFDKLFQTLTAGAMVAVDQLDPKTVEKPEYKVWLCDDGRFHQLRYSFTAPDKTQPTQKGTFVEALHMYDYDERLAIQAPNGALPLPGGGFPSTQPQPTPTSSSASLGIDGEWTGPASQGLDVEFSIRNGQVEFAELYFSAYKVPGCENIGFIGAGFPLHVPIKGNQFSTEFDDTTDDGGSFHYKFAGELTSNRTAQGTLDIQAKLKCGDGSSHVTWTATNTSAPKTGSTASTSPTPKPTSVVKTQPTSIPGTNVNGYDGNWAGNDSNGNPLSFRISGNKITSVALGFTMQLGDCLIGGKYTGSIPNGALNGKAFDIHFTGDKGKPFELLGSFDDNAHASGTLKITSVDAACENATWSAGWKATNSSVPASAQAATPTPKSQSGVRTPNASTAPAGAAAALQSFFDAVNDHDISGALDLADSQIIYNFGKSSGIGTDKLKTFLSGNKNTYTLSEFGGIGDIVHFAAEASDGTTYPQSRAILSKGNLQILTLK